MSVSNLKYTSLNMDENPPSSRIDKPVCSQGPPAKRFRNFYYVIRLCCYVLPRFRNRSQKEAKYFNEFAQLIRIAPTFSLLMLYIYLYVILLLSEVHQTEIYSEGLNLIYLLITDWNWIMILNEMKWRSLTVDLFRINA